MGRAYYLAGYVFGCCCALGLASLMMSFEHVVEAFLAPEPIVPIAGVVAGAGAAHLLDIRRRLRPPGALKRIVLVPMFLVAVAALVTAAVHALLNIDPMLPLARGFFDEAIVPAWVIMYFGLPLSIVVGWAWHCAMLFRS